MNIRLLPIDSTMSYDARICETLARWRTAALDAFADPTPVTAESTSKWLRAVTAAGRDSRA